MTKEDIVSANITDLAGLIEMEKYINSINISLLFTKHHKQLIIESIYSVQESLIQMDIFDTRKNFVKYLRTKLSKIECKDKLRNAYKNTKGKTERRKIYILKEVLSYKDNIFAILFTHELVHAISSGRYSIGLIDWGIGAKSYIGKTIQECVCGGILQDKDINEAETEYLACNFLENNFLSDAEYEKYDLELYPNHKVEICYKGCSYYEFAVYMDVINFIFSGELEKAYLKDGNSLKKILRKKELTYLRNHVDDMKEAYKRYWRSGKEYGKGRYCYSYESFMDLFDAYSKLVKMYLQRESLTKELVQKIIKNPIYIDGVKKSLNEQLLEELMEMDKLTLEECNFCGNETLVEKINGKFVCEDCFTRICLYEASLSGFELWMQTIEYSRKYKSGVDDTIKNEISKESFKNDAIQNQEKKILELLEQHIKARLEFYRKDEIFAALLAIKECIRRILIREENPSWLKIGDISSVNLLMKFANEVTGYENHSIDELENGCSYFANAISYARRYNMIEENIKLAHLQDIEIEDIYFNPIQNPDSEKFFEIYLTNGLKEKPEDYIIKNEALKKRLEGDNKTPEKILESLDDLLNDKFGFTSEKCLLLTRSLFSCEYSREEYWNFTSGKGELFKHMPIFIMEKKLLEEICGVDCFKAMLNNFSLNRNIDKHQKADELELFCFYEIDSFIILGIFDLAQTISTFTKFLISGHFIDIYKENISQNKLVKLAQKKLSNYFSLCVADYLLSNDYHLPMENFMGNNIPRADIENIDVGGKNILINEKNKKLGDIDVLALNRKTKQILIFELKFFRPAITSKEMLLRDKNLIEDNEVFRHIKERETVIVENINEVVKFILGETEEGYSVKSILLTARTNYYGILENDIEYLTWAEFLEKTKTRVL